MTQTRQWTDTRETRQWLAIRSAGSWLGVLTMKITLHVAVNYAPDDANADDLSTNLLDLIARAVGDGLLTGDTDATVQTWDAWTTGDDDVLVMDRWGTGR